MRGKVVVKMGKAKVINIEVGLKQKWGKGERKKGKKGFRAFALRCGRAIKG